MNDAPIGIQTLSEILTEDYIYKEKLKEANLDLVQRWYNGYYYFSDKVYNPHAKAVLFGSRIGLNKKGGDIDLIVVSDKIDHKMKRKIKVELFKKLGFG